MTLAEKLKTLRRIEGQQRGLGRPLSKADVVRLMRSEVGSAISPAYLTQLENGSRVHLSMHTRRLLARFFRVHPGYLVNDPPPGETEHTAVDRAAEWLRSQTRVLHSEDVVTRVLDKLSEATQPIRYIEALDQLLDLSENELEQLLGNGLPQLDTQAEG